MSAAFLQLPLVRGSKIQTFVLPVHEHVLHLVGASQDQKVPIETHRVSLSQIRGTESCLLRDSKTISWAREIMVRICF